MASAVYNAVAVLSWPVLRGALPARGAAARTPAGRRAASCSPPTTPRASTRGRSAFPLWPKRQLVFMGKVGALQPGARRRSSPAAGAFPVQPGQADVDALRDRGPRSAGRAGLSGCSRRAPGRRRACARSSSTARTPGRPGSRSTRASRSSRRRSRAPTGCSAGKAPRRLRRSRPARRSRGDGRARRGPGGDRPADGADLRAPRGAGGVVSAPLLAIDGDSLAHRAYHGVPKSSPAPTGGPGRARRLRELPPPALGGGAAARGRRRLGHARRADLPHRGLRRLPERARVRRRARRAARPAAGSSSSRSGSPPRRRPATRPTTSSPRRSQPRRTRGGGTTLVVTSDRDAFQLVSERTTVLQPVKGVFELARIGPAEVRERYGVEPRPGARLHRPARRPVRPLPGARGVGPKTAAAILAEHGTLEAALAAGRFAAEREDLLLYRRIATLDASAPLPSLADQTPKWAEASAHCRVAGASTSSRRPARGAGR